MKDADKLDNEIHMLQEAMVEKDKRIAELLHTQIEIADASLVDDSAGVDPKRTQPKGISQKFDNLTFSDVKE